jgi:hypothetical protein
MDIAATIHSLAMGLSQAIAEVRSQDSACFFPRKLTQGRVLVPFGPPLSFLQPNHLCSDDLDYTCILYPLTSCSLADVYHTEPRYYTNQSSIPPRARVCLQCFFFFLFPFSFCIIVT